MGLSTGAIYAVIGSGLVLTYTTTGVFNFAHGAAGMLAAFAYWQLSVGWGWPVPLALAVVLLVLAPLFGLLVEKVVLRPVQHLGEAERLVMTVALLSGLIAAARWIWDPNVPRPLSTFFADREPFRLGPATVTWHQAITMAVAVAVALGLWILLYRTRTGTEMRATVDDRALVGLTGADPLRAGRAAWILGTQLAAVGGILIAPTVALDANQLSLLIVSAYTAAIFGRLRSLPLTFLGAIVVGCLESYLTGYLPQNPYLPGLRLAAPALLLLSALLLFPHGRLRGRDRRLRPVPTPTMRGTLVFAGTIVGLAVVLATVLGEEHVISYGPMFSLGVVALSFVPLAGYAGQISLCQMSIAGIGAIVWGQLGADGQPWALAAAMAIAALVGALIALPAMRLSGVYLALGTAAFAVILDRWIFTLPSLELLGVRISLFDQGSVEMAGPSLPGLRLDEQWELMLLAAVCLAAASVGVAALRLSRFGRRLIALRDSEAAYATLGGSLLAAKIAVFALSAGIAGLGGALYGMQLQSVTAEQFTFVAGLPIFLIAVIGGLGSVGNGLFTGVAYLGPVHALTSAASWLQNPVHLLPALAGMGFARHPEGIVPGMRHGWEPIVRNRATVTALLGGLALLWAARLADLIGGWTLFLAALAWALALRTYARAQEARTTVVPDVPVEWRGVRRPWRPEDEEVLARGLAAG
ncbi:branched-chain amino acid ABC transporter permease [Thermomonospora cellulosilytica]|uniref:Branched-chain amino acid transport system permease protein n=1 Tax=Thermomonospora cellulosilytica TaxID=1411118 RepID=A0A7W3N0W1_9ACTN|nr:ABC transporter permease [Thermomonospora cellulosilytica]MBA9005419.1 branched-chain amino acid transport system permease protein [Thermomonospora cellulosilytica]